MKVNFECRLLCQTNSWDFLSQIDTKQFNLFGGVQARYFVQLVALFST
jgi:hypothetical protein